MFKTRRKSFLSGKSSYRSSFRKKKKLTRNQIFAIIPLSLVGLELLLRLVTTLLGQTQSLQSGLNEPTTIADYRLNYLDAQGKRYDQTAAPGELSVQRSALQGYTFIPEQTGSQWNINIQGFRGTDLLDQPKPNNEYRVVLLGGSTAFGQLSTSDSTTIAQELETKLNWRTDRQRKAPQEFQPQQLSYFADEQQKALAKPKRIQEKRYRVINAAVPGFVASNELAHFVHHVVRYEPDLIIALNGYGDLLLPSKQETVEIPGLNRRLQNPDAYLKQQRQHQIRQFFQQFYLVKVPSRILGHSTQPTSSQGFPPLLIAQDVRLPDKIDELDQRITRYQNSLEKLAQITATANIPLVVALQPHIGTRGDRATNKEQEILKDLGETYPQNTQNAYERLQQATQTIQQRFSTQMSLVNLQSLYAETADPIFQDPLHLTDLGNKILAEKLYGSLVPKLEVSATPYQGGGRPR